jgi:hypothetical protein
MDHAKCYYQQKARANNQLGITKNTLCKQYLPALVNNQSNVFNICNCVNIHYCF